MDELGAEIVQIAFPATLALTANPIVSLVDTLFIGQTGFILWLVLLTKSISFYC